jgi:hypothetical protein
MRDSSPPSSGAFVLHPEPSTLLALWRVVIRCLVCLAVAISGLPFYVKVAVAGMVLIRAWRRSDPPEVLVGSRNGAWALPGRGLYDCRPGSQTRVGRFWVWLVLEPAEGGRIALLLLNDQLEEHDWRALVLALRELRPPAD